MSDADLIREILTLGTKLKSSLEEEFIALSEKNLDHLETVQQRKVALLQSIQAQWPREISSEADESTDSDVNMSDPLWDEARTLLNECKEAHIRNDLLLKRQLRSGADCSVISDSAQRRQSQRSVRQNGPHAAETMKRYLTFCQHLGCFTL